MTFILTQLKRLPLPVGLGATALAYILSTLLLLPIVGTFTYFCIIMRPELGYQAVCMWDQYNFVFSTVFTLLKDLVGINAHLSLLDAPLLFKIKAANVFLFTMACPVVMMCSFMLLLHHMLFGYWVSITKALLVNPHYSRMAVVNMRILFFEFALAYAILMGFGTLNDGGQAVFFLVFWIAIQLMRLYGFNMHVIQIQANPSLVLVLLMVLGIVITNAVLLGFEVGSYSFGIGDVLSYMTPPT